MVQPIKAGLPVYRTVKTLLIQIISLFLFVSVFSFNVHAQDKIIFSPQVSLSVENMPFNKVLTIIEQQTLYKFAYNTELIAKQKDITIDVQNKPLNELFILLLKGTNISYSIVDNQIILQQLPLPPQVTISGFIINDLSGESLPGAVIYLPEKKTGTYTNNYGFYSITQNQTDSMEIWISYIGFNKIHTKVSVQRNFSINFYLKESKIYLETILITKDQPDDNVKKHLLGKTDVSLDMIKTVPSINGNGDIINTIQMLPGVMAGLEGRSGYFIRGGNTDQNLVQLDEATVFNPNHLLGLVSIFNSSAVKNVTLLKGGFPASFGDHLSSVLDVTMKDGNNQHLEGELQIGTISSGFTLSGPLVSNKASFLVSARRSTIDLLLKPFNFSNYYSNYYFYDVNAKLNFQLTPKDRIYLSFYQGKDNSSYSKDSTTKNSINYGVHYGNQALTLRWNHVFSQKLFSNTSVIYNNYFHSTTARQKQYSAELYSGIRDLDFKTDLNYYANANHKISTGINYQFQTLFPASVADKTIATESISINPSDIPKKYAGRFAVYFSDEIMLGPKFSAYIGARMPYFYNENAQYINFEPRLSLMHLLNPTTSIKISYTQMHQCLHLVQSYNASFPAEIWVGTSKIVKPQNSQQASLGLFKNFKENMFQFSLEIYYKLMGNQILFKGELNPVINNNMENTLMFGKGQSYGTELFFKKNKGKLTGWLAYTLSYAYQQFDSLNLGNKFPFVNDRRHSLYTSLNYAINQHWKISSNFLVTSGGAFTLFKNVSGSTTWLYGNPLYYNNAPLSTSGNGSGRGPGSGSDSGSGDGSGSSSIQKYSTTQIVQNNYRLAPYNRLDISISYRKIWNLPDRVIETEWVFSVYNVYARANTFFAYCSIDPVTKQPIAVEVSFVPIIPSISYNMKF